MSTTATERKPKSADRDWIRAEELAAQWQAKRAELTPIEDELFVFLDKQLRCALAVRFKSLDEDRREDVASAVWPKLLMRLRQFDPSRSSLRTYFYQKAVFAALDARREVIGKGRSAARIAIVNAAPAGSMVGPDGAAIGPDDLFIADESSLADVAAFRELIEPCKGQTRAMLDLYYLRRWNLTEIGELFGVGESRMCQLMADAMNFLEGYWGRRLHELHDLVRGERPKKIAS